jgi:hypothetical protein
MKRATMAAALLLAGAGAAVAGGMTWADAGERLMREREAGVACGKLAKTYVPAHDREALAAWRAAYDLPRAEMHSALARLDFALIEGADASEAELLTLSERLQSAAALRKAFCERASALSAPVTGEKGVLGDLVTGIFKPIVEAGVAIWEEYRDADKVRRASLRTALEDAKWPDFDDI